MPKGQGVLGFGQINPGSGFFPSSVQSGTVRCSHGGGFAVCVASTNMVALNRRTPHYNMRTAAVVSLCLLYFKNLFFIIIIYPPKIFVKHIKRKT